MRKIESLQAGRGIAALMVVLCHVGAFCGAEPGLWRRSGMEAWSAPGTYGVDFFFILSGIVIYLAHWADIGEPQRAGNFLWKRFRRIYPVYWVLLIPTVLKQLRVHDQYGTLHSNPLVIASSFLLIHIRSLDFNLEPAWTLYHEVFFYLLFALLILNRKLGVALFSAWLVGSFFFFTPAAIATVPATYLAWVFSPLHLLFAFGVWVGSGLNKESQVKPFPLMAGALVCLTGWALRIRGLPGIEEPLVRIFAGAGLAVALLEIARLDLAGKFRVPGFLVLLGDASYSIYLVHFMVVSTIARQGFRLDQRLHLPILLWASLMFVSATLAGLAVHLWIERPLLGLFKAPAPGRFLRQPSPALR